MSAAAVIPTLTAVTRPTPNRRVTRSEASEEKIVPPAMIMVRMPATPIGTSRSRCMTGQPAPMSESGSPRLMKAM